MKLKLILENVILSEGRLEDVKKRYPNVDPKIIDKFSEGDPSGNNKYLDWMVKSYTHEPTLDAFSNEYNVRPENGIINIIRKFDEMKPYLVHKDEDGEQEGTTDI